MRYHYKKPSIYLSKYGSPYICDDLYLHPMFKEYFDKKASKQINGIYPTVTIR